MRLSYSKLNTYRLCPLRYRFTYLDRLPRRPRRLFRAAKRIHHALMRWLTYSKKGEPVWGEVVAAYDTAWGALQEPELRGDREYQEGLQILRDFHDSNLGRPGSPVFLEQKFQAPLGGHVLIGMMDRVDAIDSGYEVIDYKLDREIRSQEEVDADLQLGLYHLALRQEHGIEAELLSLYFLRHNLQRTTVRTRDQTDELARWVVLTGDDIQQNRRWTPCVGDHCAGCDFRATCPAHTGAPLPDLPPPAARTVQRLDAQMPLLLLDGLPESEQPTEALESHRLLGSQLSLPLATPE